MNEEDKELQSELHDQDAGVSVESGVDSGSGTEVPAAKLPETATRNGVRTEAAVRDVFRANPYNGVDEILKANMEKNKPESEEDARKRKRRERAEGIISGVSDAVSSLANLIGTAHYAPSMFDSKTGGMSEKLKARLEKEKAERDAKDDLYFKYALELAKLREKEQNRKLQSIKDAHEAELWPFEVGVAKGKSEYWNTQAELKKGELKNQPTVQADKHAKMAADIKQKLAAAWKARNGGSGKGGGKGGGGGKKAEFPYMDNKGNICWAKSQAAAEANARFHGTLEEQDIITEKYNSAGYYEGETVKKKPVPGFSKKDTGGKGKTGGNKYSNLGKIAW